MDQDQKYLTILSVFHFAVAAMIALISCFPIIHLVVGISMLADFGNIPYDPEVPRTAALMFQLMPVFFIVIASILIVSGWAFAASVALSGLFLYRRGHHTFCLVMAGAECMFTPFGTVLGIFTILLLSKPEVRQFFKAGSSAPGTMEAAS
jgi:hypothetical protein